MYKQTITFGDVLLEPQYSDIVSRKQISLATPLGYELNLEIPIIASPMDTVSEWEMAAAMSKLGGMAVIHRYNTIAEQAAEVEDALDVPNCSVVGAAVGVSGDFVERAVRCYEAGAKVICIDVAHGHHQNVFNMIDWCRENLDDKVDIIAGNIATKEAAEELESYGVDGLRVGIGGGSLCTTRVKTGFGVPNVSCIEDIVSVAQTPVMADGGIRSSGDISKALALGASSVMLGSLIAGTDEAPGQIVETPAGLYKRYRGSASLETKVVNGQQTRNVEGESTTIPYKGGVKFIVNGLLDGVKSALSYGGAQDLSNFKPPYVVVTNSGINEAKPHLL